MAFLWRCAQIYWNYDMHGAATPFVCRMFDIRTRHIDNRSVARGIAALDRTF